MKLFFCRELSANGNDFRAVLCCLAVKFRNMDGAAVLRVQSGLVLRTAAAETSCAVFQENVIRSPQIETGIVRFFHPVGKAGTQIVKPAVPFAGFA